MYIIHNAKCLSTYFKGLSMDSREEWQGVVRRPAAEGQVPAKNISDSEYVESIANIFLYV